MAPLRFPLLLAFLLPVALVAVALPAAAADLAWQPGYRWGFVGAGEGESVAAAVAGAPCPPEGVVPSRLELSLTERRADGPSVSHLYSVDPVTLAVKEYTVLELHATPQGIPVYTVTTHRFDPPAEFYRANLSLNETWIVNSNDAITVSALAGGEKTYHNDTARWSLKAVARENVTVGNESFEGLRVLATNLNRNAPAATSGGVSYVWVPEVRFFAERTGRFLASEPAEMRLDAHRANAAPCVDVALSPADPWSGEAVTFTAKARDETGRLSTFTWAIDGEQDSATGATLSRAFAPAGERHLSVSATDPSGLVGYWNRTIRIAPEPNVTIEVAGAVDGGYRARDPLSFYVAGPDASRFTDVLWNFGDGAGASTDPIADHRFRDPGVYTVTAHLETADGRPLTVSRLVSVGNAGPRVVALTITSPVEGAVVAAGDVVTFEATGPYNRIHLQVDGATLAEARFPYGGLVIPAGLVPGNHTLRLTALLDDEALANATVTIAIPAPPPKDPVQTGGTAPGGAGNGTTNAPVGTGGVQTPGGAGPGTPGPAVSSGPGPQGSGGGIPSPGTPLVVAALVLAILTCRFIRRD